MKKMSKCLMSAVVGMTVLTSSTVLTAHAAMAEEYAVIVNAENSYSAPKDEAQEVVRRIFLKQQSDWPGGPEGQPFARGDTPAQKAFSQAVLGMDDVAYSDYWIQMKQTEGTVAPRAVGSASILVRQVARKPGGVSVVPASQSLPESVRTLFTFSHN